ncbi:MAG: cobalamin-dependent protein, partial [Thermanaeromonas sp.]|uniref:B12-binding domain-containing radical SAM protein n=1 Tax=Thermanaeromonas sp. TaxID=2003697 RepID=UPI00243756B7
MRVILATLNAKYIHSSLALRYLWAVGRSYPIEQELLEFTINDLPTSIAAEIYRRHPEVVAFSCYIWNIKPSLEVAAILKKVRPEILIVFGGPEVSFESEAFLKANPQVDLIIRGEGELAWARFLSALLEEASPRYPVTGLTKWGPPSLLTSLPGLVYRKGTEIFSNGWAPEVE